MLGSQHPGYSGSSDVAKRVIGFLFIGLLGLVIVAAALNRPVTSPQVPSSIISYQHAALLGGGTAADRESSFQSEVLTTTSRVTFLVNVALVSYLVFGCILIPLIWLLLFRQPSRQTSTDYSRGKSID